MINKKGFLIPVGIIILTILTGIKTDKLVIDTDAGADDAMALLLLLSAHANNDTDFDIIGITCTYGNTNLKNVEKNVLKTLTIANVSNIPVYSGAHKALTKEFATDNFFGEDGFGDFEFNQKIIGSINRTKHAAVALVDMARKYAGELSVLVLGPTTNIALAISMDPSFVSNVKRFYIMGGSVSGVGNFRPGVEFNFGMDPVANFIFLNSTREEISLLLPWETSLSSGVPREWRENDLGKIDSEFIDFLNKAESKSGKHPTWVPADPLAAAAMLWPSLIKKSIITNVTPVTNGEATGTLLVDYSDLSNKRKNVEIIQEIDVEEFKQILIFYLS